MMLQVLMDRALAHHAQGRLADAAQLYDQILAAAPHHPDASHMLGVVRAAQGRHAEAAALMAPVAAATPRDARVLANYAGALTALGRLDDALALLDRAVALAPDYAIAWNNRANALQDSGRPDEAVADYRRALALQPGLAVAHNNLGNALQKLGHYDQALAAYDQALACDRDYTEAHSNRGDVLQRLCRYVDAVTAYEEALMRDPGHAAAWNNRGVALQNLRLLDLADDSFARALALAPGMAEAHLNQGLLSLLQQDFARGWPLFEWRLKLPALGEARDFPQPVWTGRQDIRGRTLFVHVRRGLGDAIQFYRFAALAQARGARVVLSVNDPLLPLLARATPGVELIGLEAVPPAFDYHIALMSLPLALGENTPDPGRYLSAEPERVARWRARIGDHGFRIGIAWQGDAAVLGAEGKAFPVAALAGIARLAGVRLISLQKNAGAEQLARLPDGMAVESHPDLDAGPGAFLDSAAVMETLDLVITSDTAIAHLAGALGVPCWVALKYVPEWRWFLDRDDTPWYANTRLFRQAAPGDWDGVFSSLERALASRLRMS